MAAISIHDSHNEWDQPRWTIARRQTARTMPTQQPADVQELARNRRQRRQNRVQALEAQLSEY